MNDVEDRLIDDPALTDRGDEIAPAPAPEPKDTGETPDNPTPARDEKGRFAKTDSADVQADADADEDAGGDDGDGQDAAEAGKVDKKSPGYRIRQLVEQRKALREENERMKAQLAASERASKAADKAEDAHEKQAKAFSDRLDELYDKVETARADGDAKQAAQLQREIDRMNQSVVRAEAHNQARQTAFQAQQSQMYNSMLDRLEAANPVLDPQHEEFDAAYVQELTELTEAYEARGYALAAALDKASRWIFGANPYEAGKPAPEEPKEAKTVAPKKTDVEKNLNAAKRTPPASTGRSDADAAAASNVAQLSEEEYDKLPESKKRELRGDLV